MAHRGAFILIDGKKEKRIYGRNLTSLHAILLLDYALDTKINKLKRAKELFSIISSIDKREKIDEEDLESKIIVDKNENKIEFYLSNKRVEFKRFVQHAKAFLEEEDYEEFEKFVEKLRKKVQKI